MDDLPYGCRSIGVEVEDLADLERLPVPAGIGIFAEMQQVSRVVDRTLVPNPLLIRARETAHLDTLLSSDAALPAGVEIEIELNQRTAPWLLAHRERVQECLPHLRVHQPNHELLKDAVDNDVRNPREFFAQLDVPVRVSGAGLLVPHTQLAEPLKILRKNLFDADTGRLAIRELAREHVIEGYWGKSLRCRDCRLNARCDGAHINFLRDQGFAQLEPLRDGAWAEAAAEQLLRLRPEPPKRLRDGRPLEPVAPSLPGFAPPQAAPAEPLIEQARRAREARERRRLQLQSPPPA